jgi:hypothetical protein
MQKRITITEIPWKNLKDCTRIELERRFYENIDSFIIQGSKEAVEYLRSSENFYSSVDGQKSSILRYKAGQILLIYLW